MQPSRKSVEELFNPQVRYVVPMFQRKYVWQEDPQWQNLWEDIEEKANFRLNGKTTHPHYLGALIVEGVKPVSGNEVTRMLVIDGQQRLTTLQLLLCALRDIAKERNWNALDKKLTRLLENSDQDVMDNPTEEKFKIWPTTLNRDVFSDVITAEGAEGVEKKYPLIHFPRRKRPEPRSNLVNAYAYFHKQLKAWLFASATSFSRTEESCAQLLLQALNGDFFVIHLSLSEADDAQEIFYSLNSKATPLSQSDLMRSLIFMRAEKEREDKDQIFSDYWSKLETTFWSTETKRGGRTFSQLDVGLRNFLSAKTAALVDARRASEEYRVWISATPSRFPNVRAELDDLIRHCDLFEHYESVPDDLPPHDFRRVLRDFDVSTAMPLVLYLTLDAELNKDELSAALSLVESFIVRRAFLGDENKEYNKLFVEVIGSLGGNKGTDLVEALRLKLLAGGGSTRRWPSDADILERALVGNAYGGLRTKALRLILERFELHHRGVKTEDKNIGKDLTIEHVMPQRWGKNWPLQDITIPDDVVSNPWLANGEIAALASAVRERNAKIHTLGNLTLLNNRANPAAANMDFTRKKQEYDHSVLRMNRAFSGMNTWDETLIAKRSEEQGKLFCLIWPKLEAH